MYLPALLFQYSGSLKSESMAFVWEDKTVERTRERNTQIARPSLSAEVIYSSPRLLKDVVCTGWLYRSLVDLLASSVSSCESKVSAAGSHVQTARGELPAGQTFCFYCRSESFTLQTQSSFKLLFYFGVSMSYKLVKKKYSNLIKCFRSPQWECFTMFHTLSSFPFTPISHFNWSIL